MISSGDVPCFYCSEYAKVVKDYPVNLATNDVHTFTPRCKVHWKFECSECGEEVHFNGISWCPECKSFTCLDCSEERMVREEFLIYDYYYEIPCSKCGKYHPALDFLEYSGTHPYKTGELLLEEDIVLWNPSNPDAIEPQEYPHSSWGSERILSLAKPLNIRRHESLEEYNPKSTWDALASHWVENMRRSDEYHHTNIILPEVYRLLDIHKDEIVLDVACGEGRVARYLTKCGAKVTGIDISKMLDFAIGKEKEEKLGIDYHKLNAEDLENKFGESVFDKVVCNMALMDIADYKKALQQVSRVLKNDGFFVFSITHPAFVFPSCRGIRVPWDSQRNEDRIRLIIDYFDERPATITDFSWIPAPLLQFHRPISSYVNELVKNRLHIVEMSEPKVSEELVQKYPREAYWDDERRPEFFILKSVKKSNL
ncbi:MAG: class I SAM-dependent methyltransferase [Candidatus Thorarchaeota archaeon]